MSTHGSDPVDLEALFDAAEPGSPFADCVEAELARTGGPVEVPASVSRRASAVAERLGGPPRPPPRTAGWSVAGLALAGLALALVVLAHPTPSPPAPTEVVASALHPAPTPPPAPEPVVAEAPRRSPPRPEPSPGIETESVTVSAVVGRTLVVQAGAVRFERRPGLRPTVDAIRLDPVGTVLRPRGTTFVAGVEGPLAVVGVSAGEVDVVQGGRVAATLGAGQWALVTVEAVRPLVDAPPEAAALTARVRWLALDPASRAAVKR